MGLEILESGGIKTIVHIATSFPQIELVLRVTLWVEAKNFFVTLALLEKAEKVMWRFVILDTLDRYQIIAK